MVSQNTAMEGSSGDEAREDQEITQGKGGLFEKKQYILWLV